MKLFDCQIQPLGAHAATDVQKISESVRALLSQGTLCSLASVSAESKAHINTCFFAFDSSLRLFILSEPESRHTRYFKTNPSAAIAIFDSSQEWGNPLRGIQLFGEIKKVDAGTVVHGYETYAKRFLKFSDWIKKPMELLSGACTTELVVFETKQITLFDEKTFGKDAFIHCEIKR